MSSQIAPLVLKIVLSIAISTCVHNCHKQQDVTNVNINIVCLKKLDASECWFLSTVITIVVTNKVN